VKTRAAILLPAVAAFGLAVAQPSRFTLAIVRLDGRLVPFAAYENGRWERAWPEAEGEAIETPTMENVASVWRRRGEPVPIRWYFWPLSGSNPIQTRVSGVETVKAHCGAQVALVSDLRPARRDHPAKLGVAADHDLPIRVIQPIQQSDVLWTSARRIINADFDRLEVAEASSDQSRLVRESPMPPNRITALYRETKAVSSPMYFIAERKYRTARNPQDASCSARTVLNGWLVPDATGTLTLRHTSVFLTDCDAKVVQWVLPLAALRLSNKLFWVVQEHGYEDETYGVAEIGSSEVRYTIQVNGGGC
jgi:hypothetical protein